MFFLDSVLTCSLAGADSEEAESDDRLAHRSYTWFVRAIVAGNMVDSGPNSTLKALIESRKESREKWLAAAEIISLSCSDLSGNGPCTFTVEGYVHGRQEIGRCSLKKWLLPNVSDHHTELKEIETTKILKHNFSIFLSLSSEYFFTFFSKFAQSS